DRLLEATEFTDFHVCATSFLSLREEDAKVGCQIFGDCALLTLTFAPKTMEDLPLELNDIIIKEAKKRGFASAVAIDAHNSIDGHYCADKVLASIGNAAATILDKALKCESSSFEVGAAKVVPSEFGVKEGMGPGGISVIIIKTGDQKAAYVTIDGNNMVSGLREKILRSLQDLGINNGEILTTDTHVVNAVVLTGRGYHPIGEVIDHDKLIEYVKMATKEALGNLEPGEVSWRQEDICGVKVVGERLINNLTLLVDRVAKKAKRNSAFIFPFFGLLLTVILSLV
ncbi:MAG: DUF2070 family protein, partial [Nitrososphaerota archaeon]